MTSKRGFFYELDWFLRNCNTGKLILNSPRHFSTTYSLHHENTLCQNVLCSYVQKTVFTVLPQTSEESGLCDSVDAFYLTNSSVGHATALNVPCSIGNFKRTAFFSRCQTWPRLWRSFPTPNLTCSKLHITQTTRGNVGPLVLPRSVVHLTACMCVYVCVYWPVYMCVGVCGRLACVNVCGSVWKATETLSVWGSVCNRLLSAGNVLRGVRRETKLPNYCKFAFSLHFQTINTTDQYKLNKRWNRHRSMKKTSWQEGILTWGMPWI
jgi:hypothetical protein